MNNKKGINEKVTESEAKVSSAKSDNSWDQNNDRTNDYHKRSKYREFGHNWTNGYQRRQQYCSSHRPFRSHQSRQSDWTLRPDHRSSKPRYPRNEWYPRRRHVWRDDDLVQRTRDLSVNSDNESQTKSDKTESDSSHESKSRPDVTNSEVDEDLQLKLDELTALKSIFDENVLTVDEKELKGRFLAEPVLNSNKLIVFYTLKDQNKRQNNRYNRRYDERVSDNCDKSQTEEFVVHHLPPIEIYFELSASYPSRLNPSFLISCKWLKLFQLDLICKKLEDLYFESRMEVLYKWFSFLQNEVLTFLKIDDKLDITTIVNYVPKFRYNHQKTYTAIPRVNRGNGYHDQRATSDLISRELIQHLKNYNEFKGKETFNKSYFMCNICFSNHLGEECVVFPCKHMNCKSCIKGYFTTLIKEGTVSLMKCPETECQTKAPTNLIRELVSEELFKQYDKLMLDTLIGTLSDAYYCPRKACGSLVIGDSDSSLAHCTACGYAFCKNCKLTYHGYDPCNMFRDSEQRKIILEKYQNGNASEKSQLEKLYGKKQLQKAMEEMATEKWLEDVAKRCPHCKASIEKSDGCNKMACWRCNTFFCWLCLKQLPLSQPYTHFNDPQSKCYNQLFRGANFNVDNMFEDDFE